jgi:hypothetical protein
MSYVSELTETLRDSKISEPDHQAVLRSSATWLIGATKKPRLLWIPAFKLLFQGIIHRRRVLRGRMGRKTVRSLEPLAGNSEERS